MKRILPLLTLICLDAAAFAAELGAPPKVTVQADSIHHDSEADVFRASGNVTIRREGLTLSSETATLYSDSDRAVAEGNVKLEKEGSLLQGKKVEVDLSSGTGTVTEGKLLLKNGEVRAEGERIEKSGEERYRLTRGMFTSCGGTKPAWKVTAAEFNIDEEFAWGKNAVFYLSDVPVMYFPLFAFPALRERQSGLLIPTVGNSTTRGTYFTLPVYWNISPSSDATFTANVETNRGFGLGVEYRYLASGGSDGTVHGLAMYETDQERFRGNLRVRQRQYFTPRVFLASSAELLSDKRFYRDYGDEPAEYNRRFAVSTSFFTVDGDLFSVTPQVRYVQDLLAGDDGGKLQEIPAVTADLLPRPFLSENVHLSLHADFRNFHREEGLRGQRGALFPRLKLHGSLLGVEGEAWGGYDGRLYNTYGGGSEETVTAGAAETGAAVTLPLSRVYDLGGEKLRKLRHLIVPRLSYRYRQEMDGDPIAFDFSDALPMTNEARLTIGSWLTGNFHTEDSVEYRELVHISLSQGLRFSGAAQELTTLSRREERFSDLTGELRLSPLKSLLLAAEGSYNPYRGQFTSSSTSLNWRREEGSLSLAYRTLRTGGLRELGLGEDEPSYLPESFRYLEGSVALALVKPFLFTYTGRYSVDGTAFLESKYTLEYRHQCWGVTLQYRDREESPDRRGVREFSFTFTLGT